jgi:putative restriction endonuclease
VTKAVFTFSESSAYDDRPEERYHFPQTYLSHAKQAEGDWILYYEPRRTTGPSSTTGRKAYFATAQVARIVSDPHRPDHHYAYVRNYTEFDRPVPFRNKDFYYESALRKDDGSTNKGAFGRAVRLIPDEDFHQIIQAGFARELEPWEENDRVAEPVPEYVIRPVIERLVSRKFRDAAFKRHVRRAYANRCAITGLCLINGGGRPEVQAAHIRPVEENGPDTVRNGLALTGTMHWLFDRGLISIGDNYDILVSPLGVPDELDRLIRPDRNLLRPDLPEWRPHATYLTWHRENRFKQ